MYDKASHIESPNWPDSIDLDVRRFPRSASSTGSKAIRVSMLLSSKHLFLVFSHTVI